MKTEREDHIDKMMKEREVRDAVERLGKALGFGASWFHHVYVGVVLPSGTEWEVTGCDIPEGGQTRTYTLEAVKDRQDVDETSFADLDAQKLHEFEIGTPAIGSRMWKSVSVENKELIAALIRAAKSGEQWVDHAGRAWDVVTVQHGKIDADGLHTGHDYFELVYAGAANAPTPTFEGVPTPPSPPSPRAARISDLEGFRSAVMTILLPSSATSVNSLLTASRSNTPWVDPTGQKWWVNNPTPRADLDGSEMLQFRMTSLHRSDDEITR
jgi:hypothetical protein